MRSILDANYLHRDPALTWLRLRLALRDDWLSFWAMSLVVIWGAFAMTQWLIRGRL